MPTAQASGYALGCKNDTNHYGYKNSICIDAEHGYIRRFVVTPAKIRDDYVWVDFSYSGVALNAYLA